MTFILGTLKIVVLLPNLQMTDALQQFTTIQKTMTATLTYTILLAIILVGRKAINFIQEQG